MLVPNQNAKPTAAGAYHGYVVRYRGALVPILLTPTQLAIAAARAELQPEDAPKVRWWHRWFMR